MMEYLNQHMTNANLLAAAALVLMVRSLFKLIHSDIDDSRAWNVAVVVVLGVGIYLWRSENAMELVELVRSAIAKG